MFQRAPSLKTVHKQQEYQYLKPIRACFHTSATLCWLSPTLKTYIRQEWQRKFPWCTTWRYSRVCNRRARSSAHKHHAWNLKRCTWTPACSPWCESDHRWTCRTLQERHSIHVCMQTPTIHMFIPAKRIYKTCFCIFWLFYVLYILISYLYICTNGLIRICRAVSEGKLLTARRPVTVQLEP